ncbi:SDR family oxidoreductase [Conexibacter sp. CPCC 206217]|nr:SDR family oxidoreductase [Conexibacter sp. CPCC 206217]
MRSDITGKVVAIAGASSGIGEATALLLAARGARLVLGARRVDRLEALVERIERAGGEAVCAAVDVTEREGPKRLVELAQTRFGRLDVLVNNAGVAPISPLEELRADEWELMVDVNFKGVLNGIAAALPVFRAQRSGHIVNTSSTAAHRIVPNQSVYAATKTAVRVLSEGLRQEARDGLRVTVISPGYTRTELGDGVTSPAVKAQTGASMESLAISPDAIARAIAFALEQPADVEVGELIVRPTAQS